MRRSVWGGVAALALVGAGLTAGATGASAAVLVGGSADDCTPATAAGAKVAEGSNIRSEPGSVSAAKAASFQQALKARLAKMGYDKSSDKLDNGSVKIPTVVHVIRKQQGGGNTTNRTVRRQIKVLNRGFSGDSARQSVNTPFRFRLRDITRTRSNDYFNWSFEDDDKRAKRQLHQGGFETLNIYVTKLEDNLLGYAFLPESVQKRLSRDGVVLTKESLPGGNLDPYARGDTATHEVGHWLNLYHTFQGGCSDPNDYVVDTARQRAGNNVFECDESLNTCGNNTGPNALRDPVHNFMNYTTDNCIDRFTRGQTDRMELSYLAYRKGQ